ncbi:sensor domain-containing diguanylate cyclase [Marinicella rhabdoformis]|uniref:sensor domain-containing diguanylate cyclase n=1 Tax=Marinicella rhabdoformis TaxID=2580566 RepID=UPI0012AEB72F|nr:diguanylate cyclase [Marinicella rhabdoformis]
MIISTPLVFVWSSYIVSIFILEAAFVAFIISKGFRNIIIASILFWLFIGLPIAWVLTGRNPEINQAFQLLYLAKLTFNAILCAMLASIVINFSTIKHGLSDNAAPAFPTLRQKTASHISVIFSLLMSLVLMIYLTFLVSNLEKNIKTNMALVNSKIFSEFNHKMTTFTQVFEEKKHLFAEIWDKPERVNKQLKDLHDRYPFFISMLIADKHGDIQSFSLLNQNNNIDITLLNIKERPYFIHAMEQQDVFVSSGFIGKGFGNDHIVAISIAIIDDNNQQTLGILEGSLNLSSIQELSASWGENDPFHTIITDQKNQTIKTNVKNHKGSLQVSKLTPSQYTVFQKPLFQISDQSSLFLRQQSTFNWGWELNTIIDQKVIAQSLKDIMIFALIILISAVFIAQWLAWILSRLWTNQLTKVSQWVKNKSDLPESDEIPFLAEEIKILYEDIKNSRQQYITLNEELKGKVISQTAQLVEANKKLQKLSYTDSLTQLDNRRAFDNILKNLWSNQNHTNVTLFLIDIDYFKYINDQHGHPVGDLVLAFLAQIIQQLNFNNTASIARIGGEEFAIICTEISRQYAKEMTEIIRQKLLTQEHTFEGHHIKFTVSIGVATVNTKDETIKTLYQKADKSLYQAKDAGKNRTCISD